MTNKRKYKAMGKQLNDIEQKALDAVNAAVNPHGFKAVYMDTIDDTIAGRDVGEVWFTLWFTDETRKANSRDGFFEAIYYFKPNAELKRDVGAIGFGVMECDFTDLPDDPATACGIYAKWSQQASLEQLIDEAKR